MPTPDIKSHTGLARLAPNADNGLLWALVLAAIVLEGVQPRTPLELARLVDWHTLGALAGLLALTCGIEATGALHWIASRLVARVHHQRSLALVLMLLCVALATILTNDVSLFLMVPLTVKLALSARLPLIRLVTFETIAVNVGATLTPIGNPQNLFLWQGSQLDFVAFVQMMLPLFLIMLVLLLIATWFAFPASPITGKRDAKPGPAPAWPALGGSLLLFAFFILALELGYLALGLAVVGGIYLLTARRIWARLDWPLLAIIALMFIDLRQLASLPWLDGWLRGLPIASGHGATLAGIIASQCLSNVPASILLHPYVHDLPALAAGVNIGAFGLMIGSLANLIALRLARQPGAMREFHSISIPFLLIVAAAFLGFQALT